MASKAIGFLNFKFGADLKGFDKAMKKASKKLKKFGKSVTNAGKSLTTGLTLPILAIGAASVKAFDEQAKAIAQVEAGLKSTGGTVGFTSEKLQEMAAELQKVSLFGDEEILKNATAQLLTFTNIAGEQFSKTQEIALDLATRLDGDLKSSSIMLGKALNDPVKNLSALSRAGIQFSEEQKTLINSLAETGDLAGAQTIILAELETQYGGSAEAAAAAGMGPITQLKNQLSDLSEQIGARLIPFIKRFADWLIKLAEKFDGLTESQKDNIVKWGLIIAAIGPVLIIVGKISIGIAALIPLVNSLGKSFKKLGKFIKKNPYVVLAAAIALVGVAIYKNITATTAWEDVQKSARKSTTKDIAKVKVLSDRIKMLNGDKVAQIKALNKLKKEYPGFYEHIDEATYSTELLDNATNNLIASLKNSALAMAIEQKMVSIQSKIMDIEQDKMENKAKGKWNIGKKADIVFDKKINKANKELDILGEKLLKLEETKPVITVKTKIEHENISSDEGAEDFDPYAGINFTENNSTSSTKEVADGFKDVSLEIKSVTEDVENLSSELQTIPEDFNMIFDTGKISRFAETFGILGDEMAIFLGTTLEELESGMDAVMNRIEGNLNQGAASFEEYGKNIKNVAKEEIGALISTGVAAAVSNAMKGMAAFPGSAFLIPVIAAGAAGLARTAFNSLIPAFAEGGLVTGPTTALIGEGIGTTAANPEVVAPLDKLRSMIGGGSQNIVVEGRLAGTDIFLSNARTKFNRNRTV